MHYCILLSIVGVLLRLIDHAESLVLVKVLQAEVQGSETRAMMWLLGKKIEKLACGLDCKTLTFDSKRTCEGTSNRETTDRFR